MQAGALLLIGLLALAGRADAAVEQWLGQTIVDVRVQTVDGAGVDAGVLDLVETRLGEPLGMESVRDTIDHLVGLGHRRIGFISPHSHNFCAACNRVRVTAEGRLLLCLGNEHSVDLRAVMRRYPGDLERLKAAIVAAMQKKPERHHFTTDGDVQVVRFMNMTGG